MTNTDTIEDYTSINYLEQMASMMSGKHKQFYDLLRSKLEKVEVVNYKEIPGLAKIISTIKRRIKLKECYSNATFAAWQDDRIEYVEGYVDSIIPIEHAWCLWKPTGQYFDLTRDLLHDETFASAYYKVVQVDTKTLNEFLLKNEVYGSIMNEVILNELRFNEK